MNRFVLPLWAFLASMVALSVAACNGASNPLNGGGCTQNCQSAPCGNGNTYQVCACPASGGGGGGCDDVTYSAGGQSFSCNTCQSSSCTMAAQQVVQACEGGDGGSGSGSGGGNDGGGGTTTCTATTACGTTGRAYETCTTMLNNACTEMAYKTSDGQTFACSGCTNCGAAAQTLTEYCDGTLPLDAGSGNTSCTAPVACGSTGQTYEQCTTTSGGTCTGISYKLSNGVTYSCSSCSSCSTALQELDTYCAGGVTPVTSCGGPTTCGTNSTYEQCTTTLSGVCQAVQYQTSDGQVYTCNSCGDCSSAYSSLQSYCASQNTSTSCSAYSACGTTGVQYELCTTTTGGVCQSQYYSTTDGQTYTCTGCDCTSATTSLDSYCASLSTVTCGTTTCGTGTLCCNCTGTEECLSSNGGTYTCATYGCQ